MRLFDLHCDTLYECYTKGWSLLSNPGHVDLERGDLFDVYGQVFAVWIPDTMRGVAAQAFCDAVLARAYEEERRAAGKLRILRRGEPFSETFKNDVCTALLAVEGGAALGGDLDRIEHLAKSGVKMITLTWNGENELGYGAKCDRRAGLKPFGKAAVLEMERCGIVPDVSHLNERGFWDVAAIAKKPFVATHSVSAAVHSHPRNLTDEQFAEIVRRGGLCGLNWDAAQLGEQSFERMERHLYHYLELGGEHTVAMGGDMDGTALPPDWQGLAAIPRFYEYLSRKNYHESLLDRFFFGNCSDFFSRL